MVFVWYLIQICKNLFHSNFYWNSKKKQWKKWIAIRIKLQFNSIIFVGALVLVNFFVVKNISNVFQSVNKKNGENKNTKFIFQILPIKFIFCFQVSFNKFYNVLFVCVVILNFLLFCEQMSIILNFNHSHFNY